MNTAAIPVKTKTGRTSLCVNSLWENSANVRSVILCTFEPESVVTEFNCMVFLLVKSFSTSRGITRQCLT